MDTAIKKCSECDRIIATDTTRTLCDLCFTQFDRDWGLIEDTLAVHGILSPGEIANIIHLSLNRVLQVLDHGENLPTDTASESRCKKCNSKPTLPHAQYCLACQLAIYKALGDEANRSALNDVKSQQDQNTASIASVRETMDAKRARAGFNRKAPNPSIRGNRNP